MYDYGNKDYDDILQSQLEVRLHAIEIAELERHKKNMQISDQLLSIRKKNQEAYLGFKENLIYNLKNDFLANKFCWGVMIGGMIVSRTLFVGSFLGLSGYSLGVNLYKRYFSMELKMENCD